MNEESTQQFEIFKMEVQNAFRCLDIAIREIQQSIRCLVISDIAIIQDKDQKAVDQLQEIHDRLAEVERYSGRMMVCIGVEGHERDAK